MEISEITVVLDDDVNEDLINLHHHRTPFECLPTFLADYTLEAREGTGDWHPLAIVTANHHRTNHHVLPTSTTLTHLRLIADTTNGAPRAHVVSIHAYSS